MLSQLTCWWELSKSEITGLPGDCIALSAQLYIFWHLCPPLFAHDSSSPSRNIKHKVTLLATCTHTHSLLLIASVFSEGCCCSGLCVHPWSHNCLCTSKLLCLCRILLRGGGLPTGPSTCQLTSCCTSGARHRKQTPKPVVKEPGFLGGGILNKLSSTTDRGQNPYALKKQQKREYFQNLQGICNS